MDKKNVTQIAIVGWGNVGRGVYNAIRNNESAYKDVALSAIVTRDPKRVLKELGGNPCAVVDANDLVKVEDMRYSHGEDVLPRPIDVAILCGGSKEDLPLQAPLFATYFNTVDSFDTHPKIADYHKMVGGVASYHGHLALISGGWDPGTFSLERVLGNAFLPTSNTYTFWGPGVSQGHSDAVRKVAGVQDARQYTLPIQSALARVRKGTNPKLTTGEKHTRLVYVVAKPGADKRQIEKEIKKMPDYFEPYITGVDFITQEQMDRDHNAMPHGGFVLTTGQTGGLLGKNPNKASIEYKNQWASNPEATGSILLACARAVHRLHKEGKTGAITMLDVPPKYYSGLTDEELLRQWM